MRRLKVLVSYDGSDFCGWQKQPRGRTVQGVMEEKLSRMAKQPIVVVASGRTDSGVHATGQVVHMDFPLESVPLHKLYQGMNSFFPADIQVRKLWEVPDDFHARYDAVSRTYQFYLYSGASEVPFHRKYAIWQPGLPQLSLLNQYARVFMGTHDFTTFSAPNEQITNRVRTIVSAVFFPKGPYTVFEITGNGFLWRMVRSIVGSIMYFADNRIPPARAAAYLAAKDRKLAGPSAPPHGLYLHAVGYKSTG